VGAKQGMIDSVFVGDFLGTEGCGAPHYTGPAQPGCASPCPGLARMRQPLPRPGQDVTTLPRPGQDAPAPAQARPGCAQPLPGPGQDAPAPARARPRTVGNGVSTGGGVHQVLHCPFAGVCALQRTSCSSTGNR